MPSPTTSGTIVSFTSSADNTIASLLNEENNRWFPTSSQPLTYSFPGSGSAWANNYGNYVQDGEEEPSYQFSPLSSAQKAVARNALAAWGEVANLRFTELTETQSSVGDIRIAFSGAVRVNEGSNVWGYAYSLSAGSPESGDIWIDNSNSASAFTPGGYDYMALLHEIGHALGFKHPFELGAQLPASTDTVQYTVMSYTDSPNYPTGPFSPKLQTPMLYDIRAIQYLYGANTSTRRGDDTYSFSPASKVIKTIWDAAGNDTIDASAYTSAVSVDLRDGHYSSIGLTENLAIAYGATIENAVGGSGNDSLIGNDAGNVLTSGTGSDNLSGGNGNDTFAMARNLTAADTVSGGSGTDTLSIDASAGPLADDVFTHVSSVETLKNAAVAAGVTLGARALAAGINALTGAAAASETAPGDVTTVGSAFTGTLTYDMGAGRVSFDASGSAAAITVSGAASTLTAADTVKGGTGAADVLSLTADGGTGAVLTQVSGFETIKVLQSGTSSARIALGSDAVIAVGKTLTVDASALTNASAALIYDGSAVTGTTQFQHVIGGAGNDTLVMAGGLDGSDTIAGGAGNDTLSIGAGAGDASFAHVSGIEALTLSSAGFLTLGANAMAAGFATVNDSTGADVITLGSGFTRALTVNFTKAAAADSVNASGTNAALTVAGLASAFGSNDTLRGGSGTGDVLSLTADNDATGANLGSTSGFETINVLASGANGARIVLGADAAIASGKTLVVDASALSDALAALRYDGSAVTGASQSVTGGAGSDSIVGGAGNDLISGGAGNDSIDAGAGFDIVAYAGPHTEYVTANAGSGFTVTGASGTEGSDALANTEELRFSDGVMRLDVGGVPGQAYRIYQAAFDRQPDTPGLAYWVGRMDAGMNVVEVAARFIDSAEFRSLYGTQPSNADFVTRLYQNVLNRAPEPEGYNWWTGELDTGQRLPDKVLADFSESPENQLNVVGLIQDGIWLG